MGLRKTLLKFKKVKLKNDNHNDNLLNYDNFPILTYNEVVEKELVINNAEKERLQLIQELNLPLQSTWRDIVNKNDKLIEKSGIRIK